jgi:cellulase (glycosyl hydrolase family 5)
VPAPRIAEAIRRGLALDGVAVAVLLAVGALGFVLPAEGRATAAGGSAAPSTSAACPPTHDPYGEAGLVVDLTWGPSAADAERTYSVLQDSGSRWVRLGVGWNGTETAPGVYDQDVLTRYDSIVTRARAAGQRVLFMVQDTPGWANGGQNVNVPPTDPDDITPFLKMLAARYYPQGVEAVEIWNEPDTSRFWKPTPDPRAYAALLQSAYAGVKAGAPDMKVVFGGTSGNDYSFISEAYAGGAQGHFDIMATHPYTGSVSPDITWRNGAGRLSEWAFTGYREIRSLMLSQGDDKPIWFTEFGWASASHGWSTVTVEAQAAYLTRAFEILREDPYVGVAFWYNLRNNHWDHDADTAEAQFGLFTTNWTPKPSYAAFRASALSCAAR